MLLPIREYRADRRGGDDFSTSRCWVQYATLPVAVQGVSFPPSGVPGRRTIGNSSATRWAVCLTIVCRIPSAEPADSPQQESQESAQSSASEPPRRAFPSPLDGIYRVPNTWGRRRSSECRTPIRCGLSPVPGNAPAIGLVNYTEIKLGKRDFPSLPPRYSRGQERRAHRLCHHIRELDGRRHAPVLRSVLIRPEFRYEYAYSAKPWDNGLKNSQTMSAIDAIIGY